MIERITSLMLVAVLIALVCATPIHARVSFADEVQPAENTTNVVDADKLAKEELRTAINRLVGVAKAGKIAPAARPQTQPRNSNNLSKGTKIAIGVGIVVAVVAIIVVVKVDKAPTGSFPIF